MSWRTTARWIGLRLSDVEVYAFDYLEAAGFRFCVHFGTTNAVQKACDHFLAQAEEQAK